MFDFLSFLIAIVALIVAAKAFNQVAALRQRIYALERAAPRAQAAPPPPLAPYLEADQALPATSPDVAGEQHRLRPSLNRPRLPRRALTSHRSTTPQELRLRRCLGPWPRRASKSASAPAGWSGSAG